MMNKNNTLKPKLRFPIFNNNENWKVNQLGILSNVLRGGSPRPIDDFLTTSEDGLNWLKIADVHPDSKYITNTKERVKKEAISKTRIVNEGDLILSNSMSFGRPYISKIQSCIHDGWIAISDINKNEIDTDYLYYYISSEVSQKYFNTYAAGAAVKNLNADIIKKLPISYPAEKDEQQQIAECFSSLDNLILNHEEKLQLLIKHKNGLMQNLFPQLNRKVPKFRFPEFETEGEWIEKTFEDIKDKDTKWSFTGGPFGSNLKSSDYTNEGIRIIQLQNIGDGNFNDDYKIYTSLSKADELLSCNIYSGDIILSKMGDPVGRACIIPGNSERFLMASDGIRLVVDEKRFSKYFIYSLINSLPIRNKIEAKSTGSTRKRIGLDVLKQIPILVPKNINEQQKIAELILSIDNILLQQKNKIKQLKQHKKGLMQNLFPKFIS